MSGRYKEGTSADKTINKTAPATLYIMHESGALHQLSGARARKLRNEIAAGRGGAECTALTLNGYIGYLARSGEVEDFETLTADAFN